MPILTLILPPTKTHTHTTSSSTERNMSVERSTHVPFKEGHFSKIEKCYDEKKQITGDEVGLDNRTKGKGEEAKEAEGGID